MNKERIVLLTFMILAAAATRLMPHPANVAPITAMALFAGAHFNRKWLAFSVPLAAMLLSDAFIGFYHQIWVTYLGFAAAVCVGFFLKRQIGPFQVFSASVTSSVLFFFITNFAIWMHYDIYPHTFEGIMESYVLALPFFRNALIGDLFYSAVLFGGFAIAQQKYGQLQPSQA